MYTIHYDTKVTSASTQYIQLTNEDKTVLIESLMSLNFWVQEVAISQDKDIRSFIKWFVTPSKKYPFNTKLKRYNSPQSIIAGLINNLVFGTQRDFSLTQLELAQEINNILIDIVEVIKDEKKVTLQSDSKYSKIWSQENIWLGDNIRTLNASLM
jgi:hypothetical protein